jgi:3-hydroxyisobutyrate dehydrogenase-like beta-hydroxyacid dehydrogenase
MKVAFIGIGTMGLPMATNIAKKYPLIGYDVVKKDTPFPFASSYEECVRFADVIITMVPKSEHMISGLYGTEEISADQARSAWICRLFIRKSRSKQVAKELQQAGRACFWTARS